MDDVDVMLTKPSLLYTSTLTSILMGIAGALIFAVILFSIVYFFAAAVNLPIIPTGLPSPAPGAARGGG